MDFRIVPTQGKQIVAINGFRRWYAGVPSVATAHSNVGFLFSSIVSGARNGTDLRAIESGCWLLEVSRPRRLQDLRACQYFETAFASTMKHRFGRVVLFLSASLEESVGKF